MRKRIEDERETLWAMASSDLCFLVTGEQVSFLCSLFGWRFQLHVMWKTCNRKHVSTGSGRALYTWPWVHGVRLLRDCALMCIANWRQMLHQLPNWLGKEKKKKERKKQCPRYAWLQHTAILRRRDDEQMKRHRNNWFNCLEKDMIGRKGVHKFLIIRPREKKSRKENISHHADGWIVAVTFISISETHSRLFEREREREGGRTAVR